MLLGVVVVRDVSARELRDRLVVAGVDVFRKQLVAERDGRARGGVLVEEVDLLEGQPASLGDAEVREDDAAEARRAPDEEHLRLEVRVPGSGVDHVRRREADGPVPQPVRRGGEGHAFRARVEREDLAGDDPGDGSPGGRECSNVDTDKGNETLLTGLVLDGDGDTDDSDEELAHAHPSGTPDEESTTTELLNTPHAGDGHEDVDDRGGDGDEESVRDARVLEERRAVCGEG